MPMSGRVIGVSLAMFAWGCGADPGMHASSALSAPSSYSGASASAPSSPPFAPSRHASKAELVVRPDVIEITFALRARSADAKGAVAALEAAVLELSRHVAAATNNLATTKMCAMRFEHDHSKSAESGERSAIAEGAIELALAPDVGYWQKGRMLAALAELTSPGAPAAKSAVDATFGAPLAHVKNVERYRAELTERWLRRARSFAQAAESAAAPLTLVDCAPPADIVEEPVSLEEVGLVLAVTCKLDTVRSAALSAPR